MTSKQLCRISEGMELLPLKRSIVYEELRSGRLRSVNQQPGCLATTGAAT